MTLSEMYEEATEQIGNSSTRAKSILLAGFNRGLRRLRSKLRREYTLVTKKFNLEQGQSQYQAPEDIIRGGKVRIDIDGRKTMLVRVDDENKWEMMTEVADTAERPTHYRWIESDIFELYPAPDADVSLGGLITYQAKARPLQTEDYTTGDITVTNGSATVTGNGTSWTTDMIGKVLKLTGDKPHKEYYRIVDVASTTELTIENFWQGADGNTLNYRIGEQPNIPSEYHSSIVDSGIARYYKSRKDKKLAEDYQDDFDIDSIQAEADYEGLDESALIESKHAIHNTQRFDPLTQVREVE